jgi:hypothetical protein
VNSPELEVMGDCRRGVVAEHLLPAAKVHVTSAPWTPPTPGSDRALRRADRRRGPSGIGAACRLCDPLPGHGFAILEARDRSGGTWDLFRYPGVRSDSDMFTLGYPFRPWTGAKAIAEGPAILAYLRETAQEHGIDRHIRFGHRVVRADWSSERAAWTVEESSGPARRRRSA